MSQSPVGAVTEASATPYRLGWRALNRLLHEDRAFSGNERHCAFLNQGDGTFADISAASGFDFKEDGRAIAYADWDFDGDLDVWLTSRTAPRLRLLQNNSPSASSSLSVHLVATSPKTNRDAIGARVELYLAGSTIPLIRTLHAGQSFLSQSSSWLHFGLGSPDARIEKIVVHWPAANPETFTSLSPGKRYTLTQDTAAATPWSPPPGRSLLTSTPLPAVTPDPTQRIVLATRLPLPALETNAGTIPLPSSPVLVNLWSATCLDCQQELAGWSADATRIQAAGLSLIALGTDHLDPTADTDPTALLKSIRFPFPSHQPTAASVRMLDFFQRAQLDRWLPLPVPSSFLVDKNGDVAVIYKGRVNTATLIADLSLLDTPRASRRSLATPFAGIWNTGNPAPDPARVSTLLLDYNLAPEAIAYLDRFTKSTSAKLQSKPSLASTYVSLGNLHASQQQFPRAITALHQARTIDPTNNRIRPDLARAHFAYALKLQSAGDFTRAIGQFKQTLGNNPKNYAAANAIAWVRAAHPDPALRSAPEALALATRLCTMTGNRNPELLDTLAAAQAESANFTAAVQTLTSAISLLGNTPATPGSQRFLQAITKRRDLYRSNKPFRRKDWH